jgi:hypothetical protein
MVALASGFVALLPALFVYLICTKLLKRLAEVAYSPKDISETHRSKDKQ